MRKKIYFLLLALGTLQLAAQPSGKPISENLVGIFFEDLNYAADGGLYAEMVQNRSFEYTPSDVNWGKNPHNNWYYFTSWGLVRDHAAIATISLETNNPVHPNNPHYLVFNALTRGEKGVGLRNHGYDGMVIRKGEEYDFSVFLRLMSEKEIPAKIQLTDEKKQVLAEAEITARSKDWHKYAAVLTPTADADTASLVILFQQEGKIAVDMVSLFPKNTFKNRPNGLRRDLAQAIADLKPSFMRFPGGCLAHGDGLDNIYNWKRTIGPVEQRLEDKNIWNYRQSFGLGYFEYFQFCEDIGAMPVPVVAAGVSCQNSARTKGTGQECIPMEQMKGYIQDILDLIEYANGPATSAWGKKRAEAGHPEPFKLEYIGIGNEDKITPGFQERFKMICEAVRAKYPEIKLIGTSGPFDAGEDFELGWKAAREQNVALVDEHYYKDAGWFFSNLKRYDSYPRTGPKVYLGEYASWGNHWHNALAEAAYMTGLERNGDVVEFASYAPLLGRIGHTQWNPDLIYFDGKGVYPTVNYYIQKLFSVNRGNRYFDQVVTHEDKKNKVLASSCVQDSRTGDIVLKFVNPTDKATRMNVDLKPFGRIKSKAVLTVMTGGKDVKNTREEPDNIVPVESEFKAGKKFGYELPPYSVSLIRIKTR
ncbi:alpha-L-arabinofuranosidase C-terminal domain-containing protein [Bacteroides uniformis]|uniref:alpha-L-arabinofuranosidase C-terminal domain-containing protein n=1 Tax=Bacteroides uniformis TaxID=820 RepID=UPI00189AD5E0|nr:alpha-L-arabinofuranosidase C-terminal domain-containing protein [Bacteroides uniformis]